MYRMEDGRIPKDLLYGELESGSRPIGRPKLRFKDVCKRDMLATGLPTDNWELHAADRSDWRSVCSLALQAGEERLKAEAVDRRAKRRAEMNKATCVPVACVFVCSGCGRVCRSRIGLFSHERKCFYYKLLDPYPFAFFSRLVFLLVFYPPLQRLFLDYRYNSE